MTISDLPALNATLNALSAAFIVTGFVLIKRGDRVLHKWCMLAALGSSTVFLTSYLIYHANTGSRPFEGEGIARLFYFTILITHIILAAAILPMALTTTARGLRAQYSRHVAIARWTLPVWLYVSITGVVIYVMLYQLY
jgi:putative membrane protein